MNDINYKDRYWLFACLYYYPEGGLGDIIFTSDNLSDINKFYESYVEPKPNYGSCEDREDFAWQVYDSKEYTYKEFKP